VTTVLDIEGALDALGTGGVVGLPTDTVYGLAASLAHPLAVAALFQMKGRPTTVALPVLVSSVVQIEELGVTWTRRARALSDALWPGALTVVVAAPPSLSFLVGSSTETVGFRCPHDELLLNLLERSGPLALTSANAHGKSPCESASQLLKAFEGRTELNGVVDDGLRTGDVSTVVDISQSEWRIVRQGATSSAALSVLLD
jgi:tRNA threonylcarbamoyl adenosine modification protein (Sua5/YciO/YrdC/YwlC family)